MSSRPLTTPSSSLVEGRIGLLADEMNQLAMAVELLATITPLTERETAKSWRRSALETARRVRENIAGLIPE